MTTALQKYARTTIVPRGLGPKAIAAARVARFMARNYSKYKLRRYMRTSNPRKRITRAATGKVTRQGEGGSISSSVIANWRGKPSINRNFRTKAPNFLGLNTSGRLDVNQGYQGFVALGLYTKDHLTKAFSSMTSLAATRIFHMGGTSEILLSNQHEFNCRLTLFDVVARRDLNSTWNQDPLLSLTRTIDQAGNLSGGLTIDTNTYKQIGFSPHHCDCFNQYYKVVRKTHLLLSPGQTHNHRMFFRMNKYLPQQTVSNVVYGLKGITSFCLIQVSGVPINDATTKTNVTTSACTIDYVQKTYYKYKWDDDVQATFNFVNDLDVVNTASLMNLDGEAETTTTSA